MLCASCRQRASQLMWAAARRRNPQTAVRNYARRATRSPASPPRGEAPARPPPSRPHAAPSRPARPLPDFDDSSLSTGTLAAISKSRRVVLLLGGALAALVPTYLAFQYSTLVRSAKEYAARDEPVPDDTSFVYNFTAERFDEDVESMERTLHILGLRKKMCEMAKGHVLESAVGTGRNTTAYPLVKGEIKSVTMVDKSKPMLDIARLKWPEQGNAWFIHALFRVADLASPDPSAFAQVRPPNKSGKQYFDTVIQTMGVCSTGNPVQLLKNLGKLCDPDNGKIILIEHGRGHYSWLNKLLDMGGPAHAERFGCWWNRDIGDIVRQSGLEIVDEKRHDLGTTWWYVLKVPKDRTLLLNDDEKRELQNEQPLEIKSARPWYYFGLA